MFILVTLHCSGFSIAWAQRYFTTFGAVAELQIEHSVRGILSGDFNGDGCTDLVSYGGTEIHFYSQSADSLSFSTNALKMGKTIVEVVAGRFNNDRYSDLVVLAGDPVTVQLYLGKGGGRNSLTWETNLPHSFDKILVADINNDRNADLLFYGKKELGVTVFLGKGHGTFRAPTVILPEYSFSTLSVADLQDDGINDLIGVNWISNQVLIFSGFGAVKFSEPSTLQCQSEPSMLSVALLDSDLNKDLVILFAEHSACQTFLGDGLGGFHPFQTVHLRGTPSNLSVVDVNGDGADDLAILSESDKSLSVMLNDGRGDLRENVVFATGEGPSQVLFIHHGRTRFVDAALLDTATARIRILYNANVSLPSNDESEYGVGLQPGGLLSADINTDGWEDLLVANAGSQTISLLMNRGDGSLGGQLSFPVPIAPSSLRYLAKDDTTAIIFATGADSKNISVLEINTAGFSHAVYTLPLQGYPEILRTDIDRISRLLHVYAAEYEISTGHCSVVEFEQIAANRFIQRSINPSPGGPILGLDMGDYNGDGYPDIVFAVYNSHEHREEIFQSVGESKDQFGPAMLSCSFDIPTEVSPIFWSGDLNADGVADVVLNLREPENRIMVLKGARDSTLQLIHSPGPSISISSRDKLIILDVNADSYVDLVVENSTKHMLQAFMGRGDGTFGDSVQLTRSEGFAGFDMSNFKNGLIPELVISDSSNGVVKIISLEE